MRNLHLLSLFIAALLLTASINTYAQDDVPTQTTKSYLLFADEVIAGTDLVDMDLLTFSFVPFIGNSGMYLEFEKCEQISYSSYYGKVGNKTNSKPVFNKSCLRELHPTYPA